MACCIGRSVSGSAHFRRDRERAILLPCAITAIESLAIVCEFKGPPSRHAGELPSAHTIVLASRSYGSEQIEEIEDYALSGFGFDAKGYKCVESMSGEVGIWGTR